MTKKIIFIPLILLIFSSIAKSQCTACGACDVTITGVYTGDLTWGGAGQTYCVAAGATVNGNIIASGAGTEVCIDGTVNGNVSHGGTGYIRNTGIINGDLTITGTANTCNEGRITNGSYTNSGTGDLVSYGALTLSGNVTLTGTGGIISSCLVDVAGNYSIGGTATFVFTRITNIGGDLIYLGGSTADVLVDGNLNVAGNIIVPSLSNSIELADGAYLSVNDITLSGKATGPTGGGTLGQIVINGTGTTPGFFGEFEENLDICGTCTACDDDGNPTYSASPCPSEPALPAPDSTCSRAMTLPVALVQFEASCTKEGVRVNWGTLAEINNDYFTVERSQDGINWEAVTTVVGAGNSNQLLYYSAIDNNVALGNAYYRLKQTDFDGKYEYFFPQAVNCLVSQEEGIVIYPNPAKNFFLFVSKDGANELVMEIRDVQGKIVLSETYRNLDKNLSIEVDVSSLSVGVYNVLFLSEKDISHQKLVLK